MIFTENEIIFFHSITGGDGLLGIPLHVPAGISKENMVKETIQGLVKKRVLTDDKTLSPQGALAAKAIEDYKQAENHIIFNRLHIGLTKKDTVVIIPLEKKEFEVIRLPKEAILYKALEQYPHMRDAAQLNFEKEEVETDLDDVLKRLKQIEENKLMLGTFVKGIHDKEYFYYWDEKDTYRYDINRKVLEKIESTSIRHDLMNALKITEELDLLCK